LADRFVRDLSCTAVVLMAEMRVLALLDEYLPEAVKHKVAGRIADSPDADDRYRVELIQEELRKHRMKKEEEAVAVIENYKPREALVCSLPKVIEACNKFVVHTLVVNEGLSEKGYVCEGHHYISLEPGECPVDDTKLLGVENVIDELVEVARLHGVKVTIIEARQDLLAKYGGIAALQYVSAASGA
jgi:peptide subunit release factor 1 (eRF1)